MICVAWAIPAAGLRKLAKVTVRRRPALSELAAHRRDQPARVLSPRSAQFNRYPRLPSWLGCVFLVLLGLLGTTLPSTPLAHADDTELLDITVTEVSPTSLRTTGELVISGTVTNSSRSKIDDVTVQLWRDATGLRSPAALQRAESAQTYGGDLSRAPGARAEVGDLAAGQSRSFQVRASLDPSHAIDQLWLEQPDAAYRVGVEARSGERPNLLGANRFLIAHPGPQARTEVGVIVELASSPSRVLAADGSWSFPDNRLLDDLNGRLGGLLNLAEQSGSNVVIDPLLYDELETLINSGRSGGQQLSATQFELAKSALARIQRLAASGKAYRSLLGSPDGLALNNSTDGQVQLKMLAELPAGHRLASLPLCIAPAQGIADDDLLGKLVELKPAVLALSNGSGLSAIRQSSTSGALTILQLAGGQTQQTAVDRSQQLAELLVAGLGGQSSTVLVDDPSELEALLKQSWLQLVDVKTLTERATPGEVELLAPDDQPAGDDRRAAQSSELQKVTNTWATLTGHSAQLPAINAALLGGLWSKNWVEPSVRDRWLQQALLAPRGFGSSAALRLRVPNTVTTSADDNLLPVTVYSALDQPVQLRVHFVSTNSQRISIPDSEPFQVRPGESTTIRVRPHSQANGTVAIFAQLVTVDGTAIGEPVEFNVQATQAGKVGWIIIVVSGIVLLTTTAWRVRQVRAKQHR